MIALGQDLPIAASQGEESVVCLGQVPVAGADPRGVMVVVHIQASEGRALTSLGLAWPGEDPVWSNPEERLRDHALAVPVLPESNGVDAQVDVLLRVRPLLPSRSARARVSGWLHLPAVT